MTNLFFIGTIALLLAAIFTWSFRFLARERWQILGSIPLYKQADGSWAGLNLTYYGLINAGGVSAAAGLVLVLLSSLGLPVGVISGIIGGILLLCAPSAKLIARWVEKKRHTFSIGGAAFAGLVVSPPLLWSIRFLPTRFGYPELPVMQTMAALAIGYALGEGIGRLACISFGCCYGKPVDSLPARWRRILSPFCIVYDGETKKAAYAGGLNGRKTVAVPAVTAVLYASSALIGAYLFLAGHAAAAYLTCVWVTQLWRFFSEFLRADFRGGGRISAYQKMALAATLIAFGYYLAIPEMPLVADIVLGLQAGWNPLVLLLSQFTFLAIFLYLGRSQVTAANIHLFVRKDRI
ncbi:MAG: prolipoprotein diacylglyceryl transferase family protein [Pseudomonadota bacterium]